MSMHLILSFWEAAERRGEAPKPVYAVLDAGGLVAWSVSRKDAWRSTAETEGARLAKITPI